MPRPEECRYTKEHEWVFMEGSTATVGITEFAQGELGDIVYLNLGEAPRDVAQGDEIGEIESVKAVAEFYAPVAGKVVALNSALGDAPESVNRDPFGAGWLVKIAVSDLEQVSALMDFAAYQRYLEESNH